MTNFVLVETLIFLSGWRNWMERRRKFGQKTSSKQKSDKGEKHNFVWRKIVCFMIGVCIFLYDILKKGPKTIRVPPRNTPRIGKGERKKGERKKEQYDNFKGAEELENKRQNMEHQFFLLEKISSEI